jgi:hypothetical protein
MLETIWHKEWFQTVLDHNHLMNKIVFFDADQKNKRLGVNAKFQSRLDTIGRRGGNEG